MGYKLVVLMTLPKENDYVLYQIIIENLFWRNWCTVGILLVQCALWDNFPIYSQHIIRYSSYFLENRSKKCDFCQNFDTFFIAVPIINSLDRSCVFSTERYRFLFLFVQKSA